jgi:hypothetical protein
MLALVLYYGSGITEPITVGRLLSLTDTPSKIQNLRQKSQPLWKAPLKEHCLQLSKILTSFLQTVSDAVRSHISYVLVWIKSCDIWTSAASVIHQYNVYRKVPRLGQKRNAGLTYSVLAAISFGTYTAIPSFFPRFKSTMEVIPFGCQTLFQNVIPSVSFWERKWNHRGLSPASRGYGEW